MLLDTQEESVIVPASPLMATISLLETDETTKVMETELDWPTVLEQEVRVAVGASV